MRSATPDEACWRTVVRLTTLIAGLCLVITFSVGFFARELNFQLFAWPFSFYLGAQAAPIVYYLLVAWYARRIDRLEYDAGIREVDGIEPPGGGPAT